ncbi:Hypothetical_protein [Hexamita inflata]|uniref:Hypothetical_protein n=1 Tax=Hexamita inflata TaxID=28002 RepID=A0AA86Q9V5_9EUKA|nr:Hypothetical protein HINF_LOCUS41683 [Hexamita inflata]CAI9962774.1 Hypothetical protein HINF_LOCUS50419 [Hexamita inflata]
MFTYVITCDYKLQCQKFRYKKCLLIPKITSFKTLNFLYGPLLDAMTNQYYTWVKCRKLLQEKIKMATESLNLVTNYTNYSGVTSMKTNLQHFKGKIQLLTGNSVFYYRYSLRKYMRIEMNSSQLGQDNKLTFDSIPNMIKECKRRNEGYSLLSHDVIQVHIKYLTSYSRIIFYGQFEPCVAIQFAK